MAAESISGNKEIFVSKSDLEKETQRILGSVDGMIKQELNGFSSRHTYGILLNSYRHKIDEINKLMNDFAVLLVGDTVDVQGSAEALVDADVEAATIWKIHC